MDSRRFDALTRNLSISGTRRTLIGLLGVLALWPGFHRDATAKDSGRRKRVQPEGPCGNGRARANRCRRDRQCCTGYCDRGGARKRGKRRRARGRCRCRALNQACTQDRHCCPERTENHCLEGRCLPAPLLDCSAQCNAGERCWDGQCVCGDVCASGCQFSTVQAAIDATPAGSTIRLCAESYDEYITISKNLTLAGAGSGSGGTVLTGPGDSTVVVIGPGATVTLQALQVTGGGGGTVLGGGIETSGDLTLADCLITENQARDCGGGIFNTGSLILSGTAVTSNTSEVDGGGICSINAGTATLQASTVSGNSAGRAGGGIFNGGISITLDAASTVENNTPDNCAGNPVSGCTG